MNVTLNAPEVRTYPALEFRDIEASAGLRYLEGRAVPYDVWQDVGWYVEMIKKNCFAKSIREAAKSLPLLLWHDNRSFPVGVSEKWTENDDGLDVVWRIDTDDELAVEAARKARDGMLTGLSVGFAPIKSERIIEDDSDVARIVRIEARLLEVSLTPTPAYAGAQVSLVRSREHVGAARRSAELDAWRRTLHELMKEHDTPVGLQPLERLESYYGFRSRRSETPGAGAAGHHSHGRIGPPRED